MTDDLTLRVGEDVRIPWRGRTVLLTGTVHDAVVLARTSLLGTAPVTYDDLVRMFGQHSMRLLLDLLSVDSINRGERFALVHLVTRSGWTMRNINKEMNNG